MPVSFDYFEFETQTIIEEMANKTIAILDERLKSDWAKRDFFYNRCVNMGVPNIFDPDQFDIIQAAYADVGWDVTYHPHPNREATFQFRKLVE